MNDVIFLELLRRQDLLSADLKEQVHAKATNTEKADWFLEKAIEPALHTDQLEPLNTLLTIMSDELHLKSSPLKNLADNIKQEIDKETSLTFTKIMGK